MASRPADHAEEEREEQFDNEDLDLEAGSSHRSEKEHESSAANNGMGLIRMSRDTGLLIG